MKELKKIIHPLSLLFVPIVFLFIYLGWIFLASKNYDLQAEIKKEMISSTSDKSEQDLNTIFRNIKSKRKTIGEGGRLSDEEYTYFVRSLPFPQEVYNTYQDLKEEHKKHLLKKEKFKEKVKNVKGNIEYLGIPSSLEFLNHTKRNIVYNWLLSLFFGFIIGFVISLHPAIQQGFGWVFKISLALSPVFLMLVAMLLLSSGNNQTGLNEDILDWGLCVYGTFLITYFVAHRNSYLFKPSGISSNDFYYDYGFANIFNGLRICLYSFVPLSISLGLLTQSPGLGTKIWDTFQNGARDSNTEIILLSLLIILFVLKIDLILLIIQYLLKVLGEWKNDSKKIGEELS